MKTEAFENVPKKASCTVVFISVFGSFSVDDRWKHTKNDGFLRENVLEWIGEHKRKTLVWAKIFCFVFDETKTDTFLALLQRLHDGPKM